MAVATHRPRSASRPRLPARLGFPGEGDGLSGVEALRDVAMSDEDVMSLARMLAAALGIRRLDDEASH